MQYTEVLNIDKAQQIISEMHDFINRLYSSLDDLGADTSKKLEEIEKAMDKYLQQTVNPLIQKSEACLNEIMTISNSSKF